MRSIATGVAALAAIGGAAALATSAAPQTVPALQLAALGAPLAPAQPQPPVPVPNAGVPSAAELTGILNSLADPNVPFANKSNLVEGGISGTEAHMADHELKKAAKNGDLPLSFNVANIQQGAPDSATADVAVSGPKIPSPVTQSVTFVNRGSWTLSRASAMSLLQAAGH
jgi:hypothetical protein